MRCGPLPATPFLFIEGKMQPFNLFNLIKKTNCKKIGDDVDYAILVDKEEKKIRLIFKQSNSKKDWINNFNFPIKPYKNQQNTLWVARGWVKAYKSANDIIMAELTAEYRKYTDYQIEIIGWSYGGAISILAAEDFYFRTKTKPNIITFGAPKPLFGNKTKNYILSCCNEVKQYAHRSDCVTLCPPLFGYKHLNKIKLGKFNFFNLFKPTKYHTCYGVVALY